MYHADVGQQLLDLVGLQMADEVPFDVLRQYVYFLQDFLHMAFSENSLPSVVRFLYHFCRVVLADCYQSDVVGQGRFNLVYLALNGHCVVVLRARYIYNVYSSIVGNMFTIEGSVYKITKYIYK